MFGKLALRNVRRSARDYLVYVLTMTFVVSFFRRIFRKCMKWQR